MTPAKVWTYGFVLNMNTPRKVGLTGQFILIRKIKKSNIEYRKLDTM